MDLKSNLRERVLTAIASGKVTMRPKWHFILQTALAVLGTIGVSLTIIFLVSFIIFSLRQTGLWFVPSFGFLVWGDFLMSLPWLLILCAAAFIVVLEVLVQRYAFTYRQPLLYSALTVVGIAAVGGYILAQTPLHGGLMRQASIHHLPIAGRLYRGYGLQRIKRVHPGIITNTATTSFTVRDPRGEILGIIITPQTRFPYGTNFTVGDKVVIFGDRQDEQVRAIGVQKINANMIPVFQMPVPLENTQQFRLRLLP